MSATTTEQDPTPAAQLRRFHLGTQEGDDIAYPSSLSSIPRFAVELARVSSLPHSRIMQGTMVPLALPIHERERWADVDPEALRCPLFWIPQDKLSRRQLIAQGEDGEQLETGEDDDLRALRLALELTQCGLYSAEGGWVDLLMSVGVDVLTDQGRERVRAWQDGGADEALQSLSTATYTGPMEEDEDDREWAFAVACQLYPLWRNSCWADLSFWMVSGLIAQVPEDADAEAVFARRLHSIASLAMILLEQCPEVDQQALESIDQDAERLEGSRASLDQALSLRSQLMAMLYDVYDAHASSTFQMRELSGVDLETWSPWGDQELDDEPQEDTDAPQ